MHSKVESMDASGVGNGCPGSNWVECPMNTTALDIGVSPAYISLVSGLWSCILSPAILIAYAAFEDMRQSKAQKLIAMLALADMVSAMSYVIGGINYITHYNADSGCQDFRNVCTTQGFLNIWSSISTYFFTSVLAFHFLLTVSQGSSFGQKLKKRLGWLTAGPVYIFVGWILTFLVATSFLLSHRLGYSIYAASTWCYISFDEKKGQIDAEVIAAMVFGGQLWETLAFFVTATCCAATAFTSRRLRTRSHIPLENYAADMDRSEATYVTVRVRATSFTHPPPLPVEFSSEWNEVVTAEVCATEIHAAEEKAKLSAAFAEVERRMNLIPLVFLLIRVWDIIQFVTSLIVSNMGLVDENGCTSDGIKTFYLVIGVLQALGDGGQGWANAILYIFSSKIMREKMIVNPAKRMKEKVTERWNKRREKKNILQIPENDRGGIPRSEVGSSVSVTNYGGAAP